MRTPPTEIGAAMQVAAVQYEVPYTLLAALAYRESQYNPNAQASKPLKDGKSYARGLFQLTPDTAESLKVDPLDYRDATDGATRYLRDLIKIYGYDWDAVLGSWVWGAGKVNAARAAGKEFPGEVGDFIQDVKANRRLLQRGAWNEAKPKPKPGQQSLDLSPSALQRLDEAIRGLDTANPEWRGIRVLADSWRDWYTPDKANASDASMVETKAQLMFWASYDEVYDRAPLTPARVPPPWEIAPSMWARFVAIGQKVIDEARAAKLRVRDAVVTPAMVIDVDDPQRRVVGVNFLPLLAAWVIFMVLESKKGGS